MMAGRTFGSKLASGFALAVGLTLLMGCASVAALTVVVAGKDEVISSARENLDGAEQLHTLAEARISDYRGYLLNGSQQSQDLTNADRAAFLDAVSRLKGTLTDTGERNLLTAVSTAEAEHAAVLAPVIERRKELPTLSDVAQLNGSAVGPARQKLEKAIAALTDQVRADLEQARRASSRRAGQAIVVVIVLGLLSIASAALIAVRLSRGLRREVGAAVGHIQSSSAQLEAAAAQQAAGGRDQASAMNEITTTISELLITSRQIADSAQRVSQIAEDTAEAARSGDATIDQTRQSIAAIRTQVDL